MKLHFTGTCRELNEGLRELGPHFGFEESANGFPVHISRRPGNLMVRVENKQAEICFDQKIHFFRAVGLLVQHLRKGWSGTLEESPQFRTIGIMLDVSRNAVARVSTVKEYLRSMAVMGMNAFLLYMEDTYEIKEQPYFGYLRGKYSQAELREIDDYADRFGIEVIPCIQTLAHLKEALKWFFAGPVKDTDDILFVGKPETYAFVEQMIDAASAPFRSKRIHLGMDEALQLGLGKYLKEKGYRDRFSLMQEHIRRVYDIAVSRGLTPMMWSDMYFRLASPQGRHYDPQVTFSETILQGIPEHMQMVYWEYDDIRKETYSRLLQLHRQMNREILFAGGLHTWKGLAVDYVKTFTTVPPSLTACREAGVQEVFATLWGENGTETNQLTALLGMQLYAEYGYSRNPSEEKLRERFEFCSGAEFDAFFDLGRFDEIYQDQAWETIEANPSEYILWQDPLLGFFDREVETFDFEPYYASLAERMEHWRDRNPQWNSVFDFYCKLARVLSLKSMLGIRLKKSYSLGDRESLRMICGQTLPKLKEEVEALRESHRREWMKTNKAFGWEVIDIRYGGLLSRIDTTAVRISQYLQGILEQVEELEEEKLPYRSPSSGRKIGQCNQYTKIVTTCPFS